MRSSNESPVHSKPVPAGSAQSSYNVRLGSNKFGLPSGGYVDGLMDDVRMLKGVALPCE